MVTNGEKRGSCGRRGRGGKKGGMKSGRGGMGGRNFGKLVNKTVKKKIIIQ